MIWLVLTQLLWCRVPREESKEMDDQAFASATGLSVEIRDRHIGCVELLEFYLRRAQMRIPPDLPRSLSASTTRRENAPAPPMPPSRGASVGDHCTVFR